MDKRQDDISYRHEIHLDSLDISTSLLPFGNERMVYASTRLKKLGPDITVSTVVAIEELGSIMERSSYIILIYSGPPSKPKLQIMTTNIGAIFKLKQ